MPSENIADGPLNVGLAVAGLLYGKGDFGAALCGTAGMGYNSQTNTAAVGALLGIVQGKSGLPANWIQPLGDAVVLGWGVEGIKVEHTVSELVEHTVAAAEQVIPVKCPDVSLVDVIEAPAPPPTPAPPDPRVQAHTEPSPQPQPSAAAQSAEIADSTAAVPSGIPPGTDVEPVGVNLAATTPTPASAPAEEAAAPEAPSIGLTPAGAESPSPSADLSASADQPTAASAGEGAPPD